jgi:alkanesulfonate monooxygenase SsuD/methylene tetrahydromethanopterin reductase-like flavin-dependent oxidoreductase (luciferase family)
MVGCNSYRAPSLLAKITSTVDVISGGRLDWGIGAGWYENEYKGYGFEFPPPRERIGRLRECVEIVRSMWTQPETSYRGKYYETQRANCDPKPVQRPPADLDRGGASSSRCGSWPGSPTAPTSAASREWRHKREVLRSTAPRGRDEDEIRKTWSPRCSSARPRPRCRRRQRSVWHEPVGPWRAGNLVGTPEQVCEKVQTYLDLGCTGFVPWCADYPDTETLTLLATEVMPISAECCRRARRAETLGIVRAEQSAPKRRRIYT